MFAVRISPPFGRRAKLAKVRSISPASARELMELNSTPNDDAANWIAPHWPLPAALLGSRSTATCRTAGAASLCGSTHFAPLAHLQIGNTEAVLAIPDTLFIKTE